VDFSYLAAQARLESGLNPAARNGASSFGPLPIHQWHMAQTLQKHGDMLGLGNAGAALNDPAQRMALLGRGDPHASR
jgi:ribosomal protein L4